MIRTIFIFFFLFFQFCIAEEWINENIEFTINGKFNQAISSLRQRIEKDATDFKSYFYLAATLNSKMTHFENLEFENDFYTAIQKTMDLVVTNQNEILENPESEKAQHLFYLGSAYGYRGFFEGRKGNWYSALSDGLKAIDLLEKSVEIDSTLLQAYLGIGTYEYWSSSKIKFALWLPFIADNREKGIKSIKKSLSDNSPAKYIAMHQLVYILIDYGLYEEAQYYAKIVVEKYPQSQFMWWAFSHVFYKQRNYAKAIPAYKNLLQLIENDAEANPAHFIECNLKLAQLFFESEQYSECIIYCNNIFSYKFSKYLLEKLEDEISEAGDYFDTANEKMKNR